MPADRIRLLIVDDSALMRKHLRQIFEAERDFDLAFARNGREALEQAANALSDLVEHVLVFFEVNETARDDIRIFEQVSAFARAHGKDDDHHAFHGERTAIAEHDLFDVADAEAVDHDVERWYGLFGNSEFIFCKFGDLAVIHHDDVVF